MNGPRTLCYVRAPGRSRPFSPVQLEPRLPPRRLSRALVSDPDPATIWHRFRTELRRAVSDSTWHIWLERVTLPRARRHDARRSRRPTTSAPGSRPLRAALLNALRRDRDRPGRARARSSRPSEHARGRAPAPRARNAPPVAQELNPRLTFDQFVIGDSNRLAHAAALAVAEMPGLAYNPLFICGPPGLGKTHLLHSIANYVHEHGAGLTVRYTTAEAFTDHFVGALQRRRHRGLQGRLPRRRRPARRRRPVPAEQGQDRAGVLPHLQRAAPGRRADRADLRPPAARPRRARGPAARALRGRPGVRRRARRTRATRLTILRKRVAQDDVGEVDPARAGADRRPRRREHPRARGRADPRRRLRLADRPRRSPPSSPPRSSPASIPSCKPAASRTVARDPGADRATAFGVSMDDLLSASRAAAGRLARQVAMYLARELTDADAAGDRPRLRQPQPHDRHARLQAHGRADRRPTARPTRPCAASPRELGGELMRSGAPDRLRQFIAQAVSRALRSARSPRLVHTMNSPDDH